MFLVCAAPARAPIGRSARCFRKFRLRIRKPNSVPPLLAGGGMQSFLWSPASGAGSCDLPVPLSGTRGADPGRTTRAGRRALPHRTPRNRTYVVLLRAGFVGPGHYCTGGELLPRLFTLTPRLLSGRYVFCDTVRYPVLANGIPPFSQGALSCGVRTFLSAVSRGAIARCAVGNVVPRQNFAQTATVCLLSIPSFASRSASLFISRSTWLISNVNAAACSSSRTS